MAARPASIEMAAHQCNGHIEEKPSDSILSECVNTVKRLLGIPCARRLSYHAACKHHEDVSSTTVNEVGVGVNNRLDARVDSLIIPDFEARCPPRLRPLVPPANFGAVVPGSIFRSSFPMPENFGFMKSLELKTILTLVPEPYPQPNVQFMAENGIQHFQVHIAANKKGSVIEPCSMTRALEIVLDRTNHPILIHCNKGKHRTGCVVGCFRKCLGGDLEEILNEYHDYADPKARIADECFMEIFDERTVLWAVRRHHWRLPTLDNNGPPSPIATLSVARPRA